MVAERKRNKRVVVLGRWGFAGVEFKCAADDNETMDMMNV